MNQDGSVEVSVKKESILLPDKEVCSSLSHGDKIKECLEAEKLAQSESKRGKYNYYDTEKRAQIGKYASENGPTRVSRHFNVPEPTARKLKVDYLNKLKVITMMKVSQCYQLNLKDDP